MTTDIAALVADNMDIWTSATQRKSGAGRGGGGKRISLYGIERLRALILDLAVRGKLVPQDAGDEPASELLKRLARDKAAIGPSRKARQSVANAEDLTDAIETELPKSWAAVPLALIATIHRGVTYGKSDACDEERTGLIALLRGHNIQSEINFDNLVYVPDHKVSADQILKAGDIVIAMSSGSADLVGKAAPFQGAQKVSFGAFCGVIKPVSDAIHSYLAFFCQTPFYRNQTQKGGKGIGIQNLSKSDLERLICPLPPLAEQRRIVAKVDELMALCDALERESADAMAAHQTLVETLLAALVNRANAADLSRQWARLESHFDTLFTTDASIEALKQTILDLATRGILVAGVDTKEASGTTVAHASKAKRSMCEAEGLRARAPIVRGKLALPEDAFPSRWTFTDFDSVFVTVSGVTKGQKIPPSNAIDAPYLRVANVQRGLLDLDEMKIITVKQSDFDRYQLREGDVLMTEGGDWDKLGRAAIWRNEVPNCIHQNHVFRVRFEQSAILPEWVILFVNSPLGREFFSRAAKQTTNLASINMTQLRSCPIPIPAIAEQHCIVAKVDALMALCDALKARLADAAQTQRHLADAITQRVAA